MENICNKVKEFDPNINIVKNPKSRNK